MDEIDMDFNDNFNSFYLSSHKELLNPNLKVQDIKKVIKDISNISEENVRFKVSFDSNEHSDKSNFWSYLLISFYDESRYRVKLKRNFYETELFLDVNKTIEDLKKSINKDTNIPIERLQFQLDKMILDNKEILGHYNLYDSKVSINITKDIKEIIKVKTPDSTELQVHTDLCNTAIDFLEEIQGNSSYSNIKYHLVYNNKNLDLGKMLVSSGIKKGDVIELKPRNNIFEVTIKMLVGRSMTLYLDSSDSVHNMKYLILCREGCPIEQQRLIFNGKQLEDNKTLVDYNIQKGSIIHLVLKLRM